LAGDFLTMFGKEQSIFIVFIDRSRIQLYGGNLSSVIALDIPTTIVSDLDIVNRDGLYALVNQWLKQNNIKGGTLFFVLATSTYFEKVIQSAGESEQETEILKFYDTVPFEELTTKVIAFDGAKKAFATNQLYIEAVQHAFALQGFHVMGVVPVFFLGSLAAKRWMDAEMGAYVLKHIDTLKGFNVVDRLEDQNVSVVSQPSGTPTAKNNPRLMMMVGIFGVLLLVLIFIIFTSR
jgi:hypothetical protein